MPRSVWKGPFVDGYLFDKVEKVRASGRNDIIRTWSRRSTIMPDFVGLTDVADLVGCTRQNMRKLMVSNLATFPVAVHEGSQAIWHLRPVLAWFSETQKRAIDRSLIEISEVTMKVNIAKEARRVPGAALPRELEALFA